ncbi:MAG: hypothetical protein BIFFINMI_02891 [Phycisphaerae bacterium]|nr:hypothetical protein [Phycisphaerae bacterium]
MTMRLFRMLASVVLVATTNLRARWGRALVALIAVMLGVALVAGVTTGYSSARQTILDWNYSWVGQSQVHIQPLPGQTVVDALPQKLADRIGALPGVKQVVTRQKKSLTIPADQFPQGQENQVVDGYGIQVGGEEKVRPSGLRLAAGRLLAPDGGHEVLIEKALSKRLGKGVGDELVIKGFGSNEGKFRIVGVLERPRLGLISRQDLDEVVPDLVMMSQKDLEELWQGFFPMFGPGPIDLDSIDVVLTAASTPAMQEADRRIEELADSGDRDLRLAVRHSQIELAVDRLDQLDRNMRLFRLLSRLVSVVALLTASYIIFTTLGMGMVQRQAELGMLRCVGAGRVQIALSTVAEAVPIAILGTLLGIGLGLGAAKGVTVYYSQFFTRMVVSQQGLFWAGVGGVASVALAVSLPVYLATRVSPLAASRPQSKAMPFSLDLAVGLAGLGLIALSFWLRSTKLPWVQTEFQAALVYMTVGVPVLFLGYFLVAPLVVATVGRAVKYVAALLVWVRPQLVHDQIQTARWRTAATFCALMVGISMLVNLRVHSQSIMKGWELPADMPPGFIFFYPELDRSQLDEVKSLPDVENPLPMMAIWARYRPPDEKGDHSEETHILAGPILEMSKLVTLNFQEIQGGHDGKWAMEEFAKGGAIFATREFAARYNVRAGDVAQFYREHNYRDKAVGLRVVAIVEAPALNMAIDFLNVRDRFSTVASGSVVCSIVDANRVLLQTGVPETQAGPVNLTDPRLTRMLLFDFAKGRTTKDVAEDLDALNSRRLAQGHEGIHYYAGSIQDLLQMISGEFEAVVAILQKIALWAMALASLGVGFAMAANVQSRRRQLAVLRAIGMTRFQLARLVLAEAVTIALIGSLLGIIHGVHLAVNANHFDKHLFGLPTKLTLQPQTMALAIGFAVLCCLVASVLPAMRAGRTNILAALRHV